MCGNNKTNHQICHTHTILSINETKCKLIIRLVVRNTTNIICHQSQFSQRWKKQQQQHIERSIRLSVCECDVNDGNKKGAQRNNESNGEKKPSSFGFLFPHIWYQHSIEEQTNKPTKKNTDLFCFPLFCSICDLICSISLNERRYSAPNIRRL